MKGGALMILVEVKRGLVEAVFSSIPTITTIWVRDKDLKYTRRHSVIQVSDKKLKKMLKGIEQDKKDQKKNLRNGEKD